MTSKFTKILEICLLVLSLVGLVAFFIYNANTGLYTTRPRHLPPPACSM